jgi:Uma2 family endonuclease
MSAESSPTQPSLISLPSGLSYLEFVDWLDEDVRAEWVDGEIIVMSPASRIHQELCGFLYRVLHEFAERNEAGIVIPAPFSMKTGEHLPGREPDVVFVDTSNQNRLTDTFLNGPADIVVEVISKESKIRDTVEKYREYESGGVPEYWLLDPIEKTARFLALDAGAYQEIPIESGTFHSRILPGFSMDVASCWQSPKPTVKDVSSNWLG